MRARRPHRTTMMPGTWVPVIVLSYLTFVSRFSSGLVGKLHGSVMLPCVHHQMPGPIEQIIVYWQQRNSSGLLVVASAVNGVVDPTYVHEIFCGRAQFNLDGLKVGNFSLSLTNLTLHDAGTYECIAIWSPSFTTIFNNSTVELEVTAAFSTPEVDIPSSGMLQYGQKINLTCTSQGGTEQPRIMWRNASDGNEVQDAHVHEDVHKDGIVFNVTSTITFNITSNINISCVILTKDGNLPSKNYEMRVEEEESKPHVRSSLHVIIVSFIIGGLVSLLLIVILVKQRHARRTPAYQVPPNQMQELGRG